MSATLGAALKKIAVALLADRKNWEKLAVALFAVLLLFLLPILSVEAIFQADIALGTGAGDLVFAGHTVAHGAGLQYCPMHWRALFKTSA